MFEKCFTMLQTKDAFVIHIEKPIFSTLDLDKNMYIFEGFNIATYVPHRIHDMLKSVLEH